MVVGEVVLDVGQPPEDVVGPVDLVEFRRARVGLGHVFVPGFLNESPEAVVTGMSILDASGGAYSGLPTKAPLPCLRRTAGRLLAALGWASDRRPAPTKATPRLSILRCRAYKGGIGCGTETSARLLDSTRTKGDVRQRAGRFQGLLDTLTEPRARRRN